MPLLLISGQIVTRGRGLRSGYYHENDQLNACSTMTKWRGRAEVKRVTREVRDREKRLFAVAPHERQAARGDVGLVALLEPRPEHAALDAHGSEAIERYALRSEREREETPAYAERLRIRFDDQIEMPHLP